MLRVRKVTLNTYSNIKLMRIINSKPNTYTRRTISNSMLILMERECYE